MKNEKKHFIFENIIYAIIWIIIIAAPAIGSLAWDNFSWNHFLKSSLFLLSLLVVFLINNYLLFPLLFNKKKYWYYLASVIVLLVIYSLFNPLSPKNIEKRMRKDHGQIEMPMPPRPSMPAPDKNFDSTPQPHQMPQPPQMRPSPNGSKRLPRPPFAFPFNNLILAILVIGFNVAIKLLFKTIKDENDLKELQKQHLSTELEYLKYQINPHFFMNTLNNIHSLIDVDAEKAKDAIISLSKIMRYVLYDSAEETIPLEKELQFLDKYIELMKMRFTDNVEIEVSTPEVTPQVQIPPMLFMSFVENAFSHGVSYRQPSFIHIDIDLVGNKLKCSVENSIQEVHEASLPKEGGIGLENTRKRLELLYKERYFLEIKNENNKYKVLLIIPV